MGSRLAHLVERRHPSVEIGLADSLAYAEVARRNTRAAQRAREDPFRAPQAESSHCGDRRDYFIIGDFAQTLDTETVVRNRARHVDHVFGLARRELQRPDICDRETGDPSWIEAVNDSPAEFVPATKLFGEALAHRRCPSQIHLLRA